MLIVNVGSILIGFFLWFIPSWKFRIRDYAISAASRKNIPRKNSLYGRHKQIVAGLYIAMGILGIIAGLHAHVVIVAGGIFWIAALLVMADYEVPNPRPAKRLSPDQYLRELRRKEDEIYAFLSKPENAALKTRVMNNRTDGKTGVILIEKMGGKSYEYGPDFYDVLQNAVARLERDDQNRPPSPEPTGPIPKFDVVLVDLGNSDRIHVVTTVMQLAHLDLKAAQDFVDNVPSTLVKGEMRDQAELVRDVLQDIGVTVELVAASEE